MNRKNSFEKNFFCQRMLENYRAVFDGPKNSKKSKLKKIALGLCKSGLVFLLIFSWIFSGWPVVWKNPQFPPRINDVRAATQTYSTGSGTWTSPITGTITVECWGGGGSGGGGANTNGAGGGGGAGGQYAASSISVTKGTGYAYSVGTGGASVGRDSNGNAGADTTFGSSSVVAKGGARGITYASGGAGGAGTTTGGVGNIAVYAGGSGATQGSNYSGGGGGGAGSSGTGNNATTYTGGAAKTENGGAGGDGYSGNNGNGLPGNNYAAGGGGAERNGTSGAGAGGYILITYPDNSSPSVALNTPDANDFGFDTTPTLEFTGTDANYLDDIRYNIQICTTSNCSSVLLDKVSGTHAGFAGSPDNTDPFTSGQLVSYTIQSGEALSSGTYYWRARGIDPSGTNTYGGWSVIRSFDISSPTISVSVSDGVVAYGSLALNSEKDTTASGVNDTQTATNDGNVTSDLNIKTSHATGGTQWSVGAAAGANAYVHSFSTNAGSSWEVLQTVDTYETLATAISASGTEDFDLKIGTPTSTSDYQQKSITVTVQAVQN